MGGTPLYLKSLLRGIFEGPSGRLGVATSVAGNRPHAEGTEALHARLAQVDPLSASRLHPRDERRVIRALEVWEKTGQSITALQQQFDRARPAEECRVFVLQWPRAELAARIEARVDAMFVAGLVDEVKGLLAGSTKLSRTASQAVGYREVIEHLQGVRGLVETVELVKLRTRQLAKRQMTWFRGLSECRIIKRYGEKESVDVATQIRVLAELSSPR